ncbi:MAG: hypothetical protein WBV28_13180 [Terracidiphilus sp.]
MAKLRCSATKKAIKKTAEELQQSIEDVKRILDLNQMFRVNQERLRTMNVAERVGAAASRPKGCENEVQSY